MSIPFAGTGITNRGWQCPGCGRCYAPWVTICASCPRTFPAIATSCHPSGIEVVHAECEGNIDSDPLATNAPVCERCWITKPCDCEEDL